MNNVELTDSTIDTKILEGMEAAKWQIRLGGLKQAIESMKLIKVENVGYPFAIGYMDAVQQEVNRMKEAT